MELPFMASGVDGYRTGLCGLVITVVLVVFSPDSDEVVLGWGINV